MAEAIGSVFVSLGMDAADFDRGAKQVSDSISKLEGKLTRLTDGFDKLRNAAIITAGLAAIAGAVRGVTAGFTEAMNSIGDMVDMSQRLGVPVEQLQGLAHAADLSGTSIENVGKSMQKLAMNMAAIAGGETSGKAAATLDALGISATTAAGQIKATDDVMIEMADKFAGMQDGAAKTAAAMAVFGKSGAEMIPMLNLGSAELRRLKDEAVSMGFVLDGKVAGALEGLGDQWTTIGKTMNGFWIQLSGQMLPVFQLFTDKILEWIKTGGGARGWAETVGNALKGVADFALRTAAAFQRLTESSAAAWNAMKKFGTGNWGQIASDNEASAERIREINEKLKSDIDAIWATPQQAAAGAEGEGGAAPAMPDVPVANLNAAAEAKAAEIEQQKLHNMELERYNQLRAEGKNLYEQTLDPLSKLSAEMEKANELHSKGALLAHEHAAIQQRLAVMTVNAYAGMASGIMGNLSKVFGESKAFAIAQAIINTAESVTKTLATYGFTPWGIAAAAAAAAAGLAEVATIRSSGSGGGGGGSSAPSSGGGGGGGSPAAAAPQQQQSMYVSIEGEKVGREQVYGLIDMINEASRDGKHIMVTGAR
jgi:hypothetical protein